MHAAAYQAYGFSHTYEKLETTPEQLAGRVDDLRRGAYAGLNVTIPHKVAVLAHVDAIDASAALAGAANTLVRLPDGRIRAHNTDVPALVAELSRLSALASSLGDQRRRAIVLGSGGAARAAMVALGTGLGCESIDVRARAFRDPLRAHAFAVEMRDLLASAHATNVASGVFLPGAPGVPFEQVLAHGTARVSVQTAPLEPSDGESHVSIVVQATSCAMTRAPGGATTTESIENDGESIAQAVRWERLPKHAIALDVVYAPRVTPFIERAQSCNLHADNGLGMLAHQGALAFQLWLNTEPPVEIMRRALG